MANKDDDTVIYLDPKRSKSMSLCQSYGVTSSGYGAFLEIQGGWRDAMRFFGMTRYFHVQKVSAVRTNYFQKTDFYNSPKLDDFQPWADCFEDSFQEAKDFGMLNTDYKRGTFTSTFLKVLLGDEITSNDLRQFDCFENILEIYAFIGLVAIRRVEGWLGNKFNERNLPYFTVFKKEIERINIDNCMPNPHMAPIFPQISTKQAQDGLTWLVKHRQFYNLCREHLEKVVIDVSLLASPSTKYPTPNDAIYTLPENPDERVKFCLDKLNAGEVFKEERQSDGTITNNGKGLRLYSLRSRHRYLGIKTELSYSVNIGLGPRILFASVSDVENIHLKKAYEVLHAQDINDLLSKFDFIKNDLPKAIKADWDEKFEDIRQLDDAHVYISDLIHSIGYLENEDDNTREDVIQDLLSKVVYLGTKLDWLTTLDKGPVQQLKAYYYQITTGYNISTSNSANQSSTNDTDQLSNDLATRLASAIKKVSKVSGRNGCNVKDVATVLFGEKNGRPSDDLKRHFVKTFKDTRYARQVGTKKVKGKEKKYEWPHYNENTRKGAFAVSTSIKYQEFIKLWPEEDRQHMEWETKDPDIEDSPVTILKIEQLKPKLERYANYKKVADWLVENFNKNWLEEELAKFELALIYTKKSEP